MLGRRWGRAGIAGALLLNTGCASWYYNVNHEIVPTSISVATSQKTVGVKINPNSKAPAMASVSPTEVVERFVRRMREDAMFAHVIFPYTELAQLKPSSLFDITVTIDEKVHWGENLVKAVLVGASFFILTPVLPFHFALVVDLDVESTELADRASARYRYISQYEFKYWFYPKKKVFEKWLEQTQIHAVEHVLNQIKKAMAQPEK